MCHLCACVCVSVFEGDGSTYSWKLCHSVPHIHAQTFCPGQNSWSGSNTSHLLISRFGCCCFCVSVYFYFLPHRFWKKCQKANAACGYTMWKLHNLNINLFMPALSTSCSGSSWACLSISWAAVSVWKHQVWVCNSSSGWLMANLCVCACVCHSGLATHDSPVCSGLESCFFFATPFVADQPVIIINNSSDYSSSRQSMNSLERQSL